MSEPTTAAGRALLDALWSDEPQRPYEAAITAIEAEAAAAARTALLDELETVVGGLPGEGIAGFFVQRAAALAEINRRRP